MRSAAREVPGGRMPSAEHEAGREQMKTRNRIVGGARRAVLVALALSGLAAAPASAAVDTSTADRCDFLDPSVCLYPWPNNYFTTRTTSTDTGRRLNLNLLSMPRNAANKPIDPTDWNRNDGFSPGNLIVTKVPGLDSQEALAATGAVPITDMARYADRNAPVVVINARTHRRHPVWTEVDVNPANAADRTLIIRQARNFDEGTKYVVALRNLRNAQGQIIPAQEAFRDYRDRIITSDPAIERRRRHMESLFTTLRAGGIGRHNLYLTWDFTTASEKNLSERMLAIRNDAFSSLGDTNLADLTVQGNSPAFTVDKVTENPDGATAPVMRRVEGTVTVPCYLNLPQCVSGARFSYAPNTNIPQRNLVGTTTARYTCQIPRAVITEGPGKASLYGHGLLGSRGEIGQGQLKAMGNEHDFTYCATDWIGMACADYPLDFPVPDPSNISDILNQAIAGTLPSAPNCDLPNVASLLLDLSNFSTLTDRAQQGMLNFMFLGRAMIHPQGLNSNPAFQVNGKGVFKTGRLYYDGNSQGGIMGGGLIAVEPDLNRGVIGVPGMNYSTLLRRSVDFSTYAQILYNAYPNELERPLVLSIIQLLWDRAEANGYAHHMTDDPYPNTPAHHVLMQAAFGDHQVANVAAETEARTIGASVLTPYLDKGRSPYSTGKPWGLPKIHSLPFDGSAITMWDSGSPTPPTTETPPSAGQDPHEHPRNTPAARAMKAAFLAVDGVVTNTCAPHPCYANGYTGPS
jgi:hypothetical protein